MTTASPPLATPTRQWLGVTLALAGAALFASKGIIIKLGIEAGIDPVTSLAWRMIVAVPIFVVVGLVGYRRRTAALPADAPPLLDRMTVVRIVAVGAFGYYLAGLLDFSSLSFISAQLNRLIMLTYPFFVVLFGALFFRRHVTRVMIGALLISYCGIALIFWKDFSLEGKDVLLGSALVFGAAIFYAGYQILAKPLLDKVGAQIFTSLAVSASGPFVLIHFLATHSFSALAVDGHGLLLMLAIGTLATAIPAYCIAASIELIGPERSAVIGNISPVVTVVLAIFILGEAFTLWHAAGTLLVLVGMWLFGLRGRPKAAAIEVEP